MKLNAPDDDRREIAPRPAPRNTRLDPLIHRADSRPFLDVYHRVLALPLAGIIALMAAAFIILNLLFACLFMLAPGGVGNLRAGDFWNAFFFSVQTFGTIGYGYMFPRSFAADLIVTAETFLGLVYVAVATGLVFARVSRPTARITFSRVAVIHQFEGARTLMFRAANRRANQILEAEVMISLAHDTITADGMFLRRFEELRVARSHSPLFALSWMVMHVIDEASPLWNATPESLVRENAQLVVVMSGVDDRYAQRVHARHAYHVDDIVWDQRFADVLSSTPEGRRVIDYRRFHDVVEL